VGLKLGRGVVGGEEGSEVRGADEGFSEGME